MHQGVVERVGNATGNGRGIGQKFATGLLLAGISFAVMALASSVAGNNLASPPWLVLVYVIQTLGELFLSPVGLAATTMLAPKAFTSQMMALAPWIPQHANTHD